MVYRFDIEHLGSGGSRIRCGERVHHTERGLARALVNAGAVDGPIEAGRPGRVDYRAKSLHRFAAHMIEEGERGIQIRTYRPHEKATVSPALQHAVSHAECAAENRREAEAARGAAKKAQNALAGI